MIRSPFPPSSLLVPPLLRRTDRRQGALDSLCTPVCKVYRHLCVGLDALPDDQSRRHHHHQRHRCHTNSLNATLCRSAAGRQASTAAMIRNEAHNISKIELHRAE
ncbi:hypothetical protein E2C01_076891 [Portunus trituberculatus]|uniref:Uncharacterized protein n=1 Tax=Portunus trituberculatus TaxID=210409 RepID=A0A5B7IN66_PORTR|nr:hypothetical protein [Portunus trituberculatus]